jgi:hypothetical protein
MVAITMMVFLPYGLQKIVNENEISAILGTKLKRSYHYTTDERVLAAWELSSLRAGKAFAIVFDDVYT